MIVFRMSHYKPPLMHRCRPSRLVHPLRGCGDTRGNAIGYRYASPDGDGWAVVATAVHFLTQSPSDHCSLITVHSSYTFSAKERDTETGLSYFGSRYYSSDLSIWLSVDPMSGKYPSLSPYVYCADNPVKLVDPNGEEMEIVADNLTTNKLSHDNQPSPILPQGKPTREQKLSDALSTMGKGESITGKELAQAIGVDDVAKCVKSITRTGDNSFSVKRTALGMVVLKDSHLKINKVKLKINGNVETAYRIQIQYTKFAKDEGALPDFYINNDDILYYDENGKLKKGYYE